MTEPAPSIKCTRCRVTVPLAAINPPPPAIHCGDPDCPLHSKEERDKWRAQQQKARA